MDHAHRNRLAFEIIMLCNTIAPIDPRMLVASVVEMIKQAEQDENMEIGEPPRYGGTRSG